MSALVASDMAMALYEDFLSAKERSLNDLIRPERAAPSLRPANPGTFPS
jgi:hypothetical protein